MIIVIDDKTMAPFVKSMSKLGPTCQYFQFKTVGTKSYTSAASVLG